MYDLPRFNAARGFVGGAAGAFPWFFGRGVEVSMPHAALWVVQPENVKFFTEVFTVSMPHAALWVVQQSILLLIFRKEKVSMPHAALWVVQPASAQNSAPSAPAFQCRTRLCGWCRY